MKTETQKNIYHFLCRKLDELSKQYNPCQFIDGKCKYCRDNNMQENSCCPNTCKCLTETGCNTKNLMCKLGFACDVVENNTELNAKISDIRELAKKHGLHGNYFFKDANNYLNQTQNNAI